MTKQYKILDHSSTSGLDYIGESTENCSEDNAKIFASEKEAIEWLDFQADRGTKFFDGYANWSTVVECWA